MQEVRKQKKVFSRFQIDIKYLTDIPEYEIWRWEHHFPKYLISARDYKTGAVYLAYTQEKSLWLQPCLSIIYFLLFNTMA